MPGILLSIRKRLRAPYRACELTKADIVQEFKHDTRPLRRGRTSPQLLFSFVVGHMLLPWSKYRKHFSSRVKVCAPWISPTSGSCHIRLIEGQLPTFPPGVRRHLRSTLVICPVLRGGHITLMSRANTWNPLGAT